MEVYQVNQFLASNRGQASPNLPHTDTVARGASILKPAIFRDFHFLRETS